MALKRVRTKSSDNTGNIDSPKKSKETSPRNKRSPSPPKDKRSPSPKIEPIRTNGVNGLNGTKHAASKFTLRLVSHGRVNGPVEEPEEHEEMLNFSVRDIPNPPAKLRKNYTGLSSRLRKEVFSDKAARLKYDTIVIEMEKMMNAMETAMTYDTAHQEEVDDPTPTTLIVSIQCEEGKHRSVSYVEELAQSTKRKDWAVTVVHRDLGMIQGAEAEDSEDDEPSSPTNVRPMAIKQAKKKKDKQLKRSRTQRLQVEVVGSGAEDGFF